MNFMNAAYDGERGTNGPYMEYIPAGDVETSLSLSRWRVLIAANYRPLLSQELLC